MHTLRMTSSIYKHMRNQNTGNMNNEQIKDKIDYL